MDQTDVAAVYILYNPNFELLEKSIAIARKQVHHVILIDNSEHDNSCRFVHCNGQNTFFYVWNRVNIGIAKALNRGYELAINSGCKWVLSLDQDSIIEDNMISSYLEYLQINKQVLIGALMPSFYLCPNAVNLIGGQDEECEDYMTSGSLVNLQAYKRVGGFNDELFIDMVDTDFGFKLIQHGYSIVRLKDVVMNHNIGNSTDISIFGKHLFYITNHNYIRRYYITRNLLYIKTVYKDQFKEYASPNLKIFKSVIRIILFEKDKWRKLKSVRLGIKDFKNNRYGKYSY